MQEDGPELPAGIDDFFNTLPDAGERIDDFINGLRDAGERIDDFINGLPDAGERIDDFVNGLPGAGERIDDFINGLPDAGEGIDDFINGLRDGGEGIDDFVNPRGGPPGSILQISLKPRMGTTDDTDSTDHQPGTAARPVIFGMNPLNVAPRSSSVSSVPSVVLIPIPGKRTAVRRGHPLTDTSALSQIRENAGVFAILRLQFCEIPGSDKPAHP